MDDLTEKLLREAEYAPGLAAARVRKAAPAKTLTPSLQKSLETLQNEVDRSMGYISNALAYSHRFRNAREHSNLIRLIKGGFVGVSLAEGPPPHGTIAHRDSRFSDRYYWLEIL